MGLEALGEDWSLSLLGPRDRLEAAVRPALARLSRRRPTGAQTASVCPLPSGAAAPLACRSGSCWTPCPAYSGEPLAEVDDWRRTRWDALVMQAAMPDPRWMPGQAAGERLEPMPPRPGRHRRELAVDGESALLLFCPLPSPEVPMEAAWRLLARLHEPAFQRRLRDELQLGYALFCGFREVGARRGLLFAAQSPRACPERLLEHMETFLQRSVEALAQLPAQRLAGLREALADDLRRAPGSFAERARRAWAEHLGGGAGRSRLLAEAALGLSGDDLLAAQARLLERAAAGGCFPAGAEASHAVTRRQPCRRHCGVRSKAALLRWRSRRDQGCATAGGALPAPCAAAPTPTMKKRRSRPGSVWPGFPGFDNRLRHDRPGRFTSRSAP